MLDTSFIPGQWTRPPATGATKGDLDLSICALSLHDGIIRVVSAFAFIPIILLLIMGRSQEIATFAAVQHCPGRNTTTSNQYNTDIVGHSTREKERERERPSTTSKERERESVCVCVSWLLAGPGCSDPSVGLNGPIPFPPHFHSLSLCSAVPSWPCPCVFPLLSIVSPSASGPGTRSSPLDSAPLSSRPFPLPHLTWDLHIRSHRLPSIHQRTQPTRQHHPLPHILFLLSTAYLRHHLDNSDYDSIDRIVIPYPDSSLSDDRGRGSVRRLTLGGSALCHEDIAPTKAAHKRLLAHKSMSR